MVPPNIVSEHASFLSFDRRTDSKSMTEGHFHNFYELYCLKSGSSSYFIENKTIDISPGDLIFLPPHTIHKTNYKSAVHERIVINFTADYIPEVIKEDMHVLFETNIYRPKNSELFYQYFAKIEAVFVKDDAISKLLLRNYITELFCSAITLPSLPVQHKTIEKPIDTVEHITKYISENYAQDISFEQFVQWSGYTPNYLSKLFKDTTGINYKEYLSLIRLNAAEHLLATTNYAVSDISQQCGFNDSNYFSFVFKKKYGLAPLAFRKFIRGNKISG